MVPPHRIELQIDAYKATVIPFNYKGVFWWSKWDSNPPQIPCKGFLLALSLPQILMPILMVAASAASPSRTGLVEYSGFSTNTETHNLTASVNHLVNCEGFEPSTR